MSERILAIETSTLSCSVALFQGDVCIHANQCCESQHVHASSLLPMIDAAMDKSGWRVANLAAVAVCGGPGSYTGLRIGTSAAKGICHAKGIPLIAINSLEIQAYHLASSALLQIDSIVIAVIDARRNEVYTQTFRWSGRHFEALDETRALVIDPNTNAKALFPAATGGTFVVGDAAEKVQRLLKGKGLNWQFIPANPTAECARISVRNAMAEQRFEDVAYYTPKYLKDFQAGKPKDPLGLRKSTSA
ncbi:MAG: tRNA (adenosine(37)-N6)-threonylcarbamoyltransferase complex dimerization subunit type 1 TsaB [Crocinitomicaceae bacterium]|nr:tRNA (adenosine(37)-N6)-threonylcarbamoyltransferase complex dimerization subunit type 1 TsaB [Crocinitomicaceae bacterium]